MIVWVGRVSVISQERLFDGRFDDAGTWLLGKNDSPRLYNVGHQFISCQVVLSILFNFRVD